MTITRRIFSAALALAFVLALVALPAPARAAEASSISLDKSSINIMNKDVPGTATLTAVLKGLPDGDPDMHSIEWEVAPKIADLDADATSTSATGNHDVTITGRVPGTATITAYALNAANARTGVKATCKLTVKQTLTVSVNYGDTTLNTDVNESGIATASVSPTGYESFYRIDWTSSNENVANVSGGTSATYVATKDVGSATIRATVTPIGSNAEYFKSDYDEFTVTTESTAPYLKISKNPSSTITAHSFPGTVTVTLYNDTTGSVSWKNSDSSVIKETGHDSSISGGTATFDFDTRKNGSSTVTATVTLSDGTKLTASTTVRVNKPMPILSLDGASHMSASNRNITLTAKLDDNDTNTYDGDERIHWSSSNKKLVSVISSDSHLDDYVAQAVIRSHYNGTSIKITVEMADNENISAYHTVYVTGLTYLPQTGQDTTLLYVIGGLCVLMFAAAGILYARRKKQENA